MTIIVTIIGTIVGTTSIAVMGTIMAHELMPVDKVPAWLDKSYNTIVKVLDKLFA